MAQKKYSAEQVLELLPTDREVEEDLSSGRDSMISEDEDLFCEGRKTGDGYERAVVPRPTVQPIHGGAF